MVMHPKGPLTSTQTTALRAGLYYSPSLLLTTYAIHVVRETDVSIAAPERSGGAHNVHYSRIKTKSKIHLIFLFFT